MRLRTVLSALGSSVLAILAGVVASIAPVDAQCTYPTPVTPDSCQAAKQYNAQTSGLSLLVWVDGVPVCEDYPGSGGPAISHEIWSCTKSYNATAAAAAIDDGLISGWDEPLVNTFPEWAGDPRKSQITLRQLLSLTSGILADSGNGTPTYAAAIQEPAIHDPGTVYEYGDTPYQIFGEFMRRKVDPTYVDPLAYLQDRILTPIGASYGGWNRGSDNMPQLPWGSQWTAQEMIKYGELIRRGGYWAPTGQQLVSQEVLDEAYHAWSVNPDYGLTWWLPSDGAAKSCDAILAYGLGSQRIYVIRSLKLVAVRQAPFWGDLGFDDDTLLDRLIDIPNPQDDCAPAEAAQLLLTRVDSDIAFDWAPVNQDSTGNDELLGGYELLRATQPNFSDAIPINSTVGPRSAMVMAGEATAGSISYYQVRAFDKCGNVGP